MFSLSSYSNYLEQTIWRGEIKHSLVHIRGSQKVRLSSLCNALNKLKLLTHSNQTVLFPISNTMIEKHHLNDKCINRWILSHMIRSDEYNLWIISAFLQSLTLIHVCIYPARSSGVTQNQVISLVTHSKHGSTPNRVHWTVLTNSSWTLQSLLSPLCKDLICCDGKRGCKEMQHFTFLEH